MWRHSSSATARGSHGLWDASRTMIPAEVAFVAAWGLTYDSLKLAGTLVREVPPRALLAGVQIIIYSSAPFAGDLMR